ncbi:MAG: hypothetical protein LBN93_03320 [Candidatus Symbiothrix sp.]|jgi:hypothetical protein|nr:hypothetical protein [Candidatus Symbiothrix sp.]
MKRLKLVLLVAALLFTVTGSLVTAQVVIGSSTQEANAGAILDLSKSGDGLNTNLGLLLPSVNLTAADMLLIPHVDGVDDVPNVEGMLVYCPGGDGNLDKGLYVWDGTEWKGVILS